MAITNDNSPPRRVEYQHDPPIGSVTVDYSGGDQSLEAYNIRGLHCTAAGSLSVVMLDGTSSVVNGLAGQDYPRRIRQVNQSGSTGTWYALY